MSTSKLDTGIRQEQIAEAALTLVQSHGLRGLSIERIALSVGLAPSALYRHFKDKASILDAVIELLGKKLMDIVDSVGVDGRDPLERLSGLFRRHVMLVQQFHAMPRILFSDQVYVGDPARKARLYGMIQAYLKRVAGIVRQGQTGGSIRADLDPDTVAIMFLGLFQPTAMLWFMSDGGFDVTKHMDRAWRVFAGAIRA